MSEYLFAYGTLIPGCEPAQMNSACSRLEFVAEGTVRGILYDLGTFPGVIEGDGVVRGVVLRVPSDAWAEMDAYSSGASTRAPRSNVVKNSTAGFTFTPATRAAVAPSRPATGAAATLSESHVVSTTIRSS